MDIKNWIEGGTGIQTAETAFRKEVKTPFIVFMDKSEVSGHDTKNCIMTHDLTVEYYNRTVNKEDEKKIGDLLNMAGMEYTEERVWVDEEKVYMTTYGTTFKEKIRDRKGV